MKRLLQLLAGVGAGLVVLMGGIWALGRALGDHEALYEGEPMSYWCERLTNREPVLSNQANAVLNTRIVPQLTNQMFSDTNDSTLRLALVDQLNTLPGVRVYFTPADGRRVQAVMDLGFLGPSAKAAIPALLEALRRQDDSLCDPAADALVKIQAEPETLVPALLDCLVDGHGQGRPDVVEALGELGPKSKAAVPMLLKLLGDRRSKELAMAVPKALKQIDPEAAARAGVK